MTEFILTVAGAGAGLGITLVALGIYGREPNDMPAFRHGRRWLLGRRGSSARWGLACGAGALVWLVSGWPVAGIALAVAGAFLPWLFGAGKLAEQRIERLEALEDWLRGLADVLRAGNAGLVGALLDSANDVAPAIRAEVTTLGQRLRTWDVAGALLQFADDVDDQIGDAAAAGLCVAHQQGTGTAELLTTLARQVAADVAARRGAETERARRRSAARILLGLWAVMFVGFAAFGSDSYTSVYSSVGGQLVLAVVLGVVGVAVVWLRRLGVEPPAPRFLLRDPS
ncbi:type II secretion system protein [Amycolatopsis mediterranei S699]|uniref:Type II secretion system protein n=2 Tax=Amycolatopsis mediterranei TaxID=33910 RepID=A0A0H3DFF7_AMYMU|nr:type II secretion system protein [Amycolatopsis mediterranei]ADJ48813.1 type II secretion system protein [Amycolatopsis mediterranei U32]AEK45753.1 type II secretion system protein [Amycolatopsis mediterranei S699]AFO80522.1 type II secretion system protein [Amycolatopsis mediterranei S699]AGT87650.1 type II secretion system protein [Amycolatopsis mediterranei RB]KDU94078.1 type II secretion system protein [Amycolatopsis mediterranei]